MKIDEFTQKKQIINNLQQKGSKHIKLGKHIDMSNRIFWSRKTKKENIRGKFQLQSVRGGERQIGQFKKLMKMKKFNHSLEIQINSNSPNTLNQNNNPTKSITNTQILSEYKFPFKTLKSEQEFSEKYDFTYQNITQTRFPHLSYKNIEIQQTKNVNKSVKIRRNALNQKQLSQQKNISTQKQGRQAHSLKKLTQVNISLNFDELLSSYSTDKKNKLKDQKSFISLQRRKQNSGKRIRKDETSRKQKNNESNQLRKKNSVRNLDGPEVKLIAPLYKKSKQKIHCKMGGNHVMVENRVHKIKILNRNNEGKLVDEVAGWNIDIESPANELYNDQF